MSLPLSTGQMYVNHHHLRHREEAGRSRNVFQRKRTSWGPFTGYFDPNSRESFPHGRLSVKHILESLTADFSCSRLGQSGRHIKVSWKQRKWLWPPDGRRQNNKQEQWKSSHDPKTLGARGQLVCNINRTNTSFAPSPAVSDVTALTELEAYGPCCLHQSKFLLRHDSPPGRGGGHTSMCTYLPPLGCTLNTWGEWSVLRCVCHCRLKNQVLGGLRSL